MAADRHADVLLLLASRDDGLWLPGGTLRTQPGFAPAVLEPCRSCGGVLLVDDFGHEVKRRKGTGLVRDRFGRRQPCSACGGAGQVARDPMDATGARVGSSETTSTARPRRTVRCDACDGEGAHGNGSRCEVCDGAGRRDLHAFELVFTPADAITGADPVDVAIDRRNAAGSYFELDRAIGALSARSLGDRRRVGSLLAAVDAGSPLSLVDAFVLGELVARMPAAVRVPAGVRANAKLRRERRTRAKGRGTPIDVRNREIVKLARAGHPAQWLAVEYGVSVSTVYAAVKGRTMEDDVETKPRPGRWDEVPGNDDSDRWQDVAS